jgi:hypothetical protein
MRVTLGSCRGILSGWLIAATVPLLADPRSIAAWTATGLGDRSRIGLAAAELLGAALFAFELTAAAGFALLLAAFVVVATLHIHHREVPWWLAAYALAGVVLLYFTRRERKRQTRGGAIVAGV